MRRAVSLLVLILTSACASFADGCATGTPVATFNIKVLPPKGGSPLPLNAVNALTTGDKLRYEPVTLTDELKNSARVSVIVIPAADADAKHFRILPAEPVKDAAEWQIPQTASAVGLIFGSYGIDTKKVTTLVQKHPEIITKLADYAEQNTRVEALVQTLSNYEKSPPTGKSLQSVLQGFSSQYGVQLPAFDSKTASSQQVLGVLKAIAPAVNTPDPLTSPTNVALKAGGLAESVAVTYFGAPVALTFSGAALLQSLHSSLFPPTNFQSAFAQAGEAGATNLCAAKADAKDTKAHIDYIWMSRIPNQDPPSVSLTADAHLPAGMSSTFTVSAATVSQLESLSRARDWQLASGANAFPVPAKITTGPAGDTITIDLTRTKVDPGQYQLAGDWDWTPFKVSGKVEVHAFGDMSKASLTLASRDALITAAGPVEVQLTGTDFEFVDSVLLMPPRRPQKPITLEFALPKGRQLGTQTEMQAEIDTTGLAPGAYSLAVHQVNGVTGQIPVTIHPQNPELSQLPLRVNVGEPQQDVILHGKRLEHIERITSAHAEWTLPAEPEGANELTERLATVKLSSMAQRGDRLDAEIFVKGLEQPLKVDGMAKVAPARPKITAVTKSFAGVSGVELRDGEIPAGMAVSFALQAQGVDAHPLVKLSCSSDSDTRRAISISPGDKADSAELDLTGHGSLFLSVDPGVVGESGCRLTAAVTEPETGTSDPFVLGRVTRLPHISNFMPTDEKIGDSSYAATLTGQGLQLIEKAGWGAANGEPVQGIPTPIPGNIEQTLKIAVPWPPPSPKAPLYIWLRGENQPRVTTARY